MAFESPRGWSHRVADNLKRAIESSGKSLNDLAEETGIPLSTLSRRNRGITPWTTTEIEGVLSRIDVHPADIFTFERAEAS